MMSFYNAVNGMNASLAVQLSILLDKRIDEFFPRFRSVFTKDDECPIDVEYDFIVYTRMGGGNRNCWEGSTDKDCDCPAHTAEKIELEPYVVGRYDDAFDCTYSSFLIKLSEEQKSISSEERRRRFTRLFPEIADEVEENADTKSI